MLESINSKYRLDEKAAKSGHAVSHDVEEEPREATSSKNPPMGTDGTDKVGNVTPPRTRRDIPARIGNERLLYSQPIHESDARRQHAASQSNTPGSLHGQGRGQQNQHERRLDAGTHVVTRHVHTQQLQPSQDQRAVAHAYLLAECSREWILTANSHAEEEAADTKPDQNADLAIGHHACGKPSSKNCKHRCQKGSSAATDGICKGTKEKHPHHYACQSCACGKALGIWRRKFWVQATQHGQHQIYHLEVIAIRYKASPSSGR
mmetsp:Transcript_130595/g.227047  ORF Transcript_130595/g.227047 Transcript_130595/m.227047 type:complete len:263 (+) Transcript_130595:537-1325(+)